MTEQSTTFVTDFPLCKDFPHKALVPSIYSVRKGPNSTVFLYESGENIQWVELRGHENSVQDVLAAISNLGGSIFHKRHPHEINRMIWRQANGAIIETDKALWAELDSLSKV